MQDQPSSDTPIPSANPAPGSDDAGETPPLPPLGILAGLSSQSLANVAAYGKYHHFAAGAEIIREGKPQDRFYIVVSGKLAISARDVALNVAEPGECLGEVSLLEPGPASATVRALEDATLWSMNIADLRAYISEHIGGGGVLLMGMASCLSKRLREANQLIGQHHAPSPETLPQGHERAITAGNTPVQIRFFERLKNTLGGTRKVRISTKIKL